MSTHPRALHKGLLDLPRIEWGGHILQRHVCFGGHVQIRGVCFREFILEFNPAFFTPVVHNPSEGISKSRGCPPGTQWLTLDRVRAETTGFSAPQNVLHTMLGPG
jgi:hypothetical protein